MHPPILVDPEACELLPGFDRLRHAEHEIPGRWRPRLLAAYARQRGAYDQAKVRYERKQREARAWLLGGGVLGVLLLSSGCAFSWRALAQPEAGALWLLAPLMVLLGLALLVGSGLYQGVVLSAQRPRPAPHPLPAARRLTASLLPTWFERLRGEVVFERYADMPDDETAQAGWLGEKAFVEMLQNQLPDGYLLHRIKQNRGRDDLDVVIVSRRGIWLFEVKYWTGRIVWRKGAWRRESLDPRFPRELHIGEPPDQQWQRMQGEVLETLERRMPSQVRRVPLLRHVRGGLVFNHPGCELRIAPDAPFVSDLPAGWLERYRQAPLIEGVDERTCLEVVGVLLGRHQRTRQGGVTRSMDQAAERLVGQAEEALGVLARKGHARGG